MRDIDEIIKSLLPYKDNIIVCLDGAHALWNIGGLGWFTVFAVEPIVVEGVRVRVLPDCFETKQYVELRGLYCTDKDQTLLDYLEYEDDVNPDDMGKFGYYYWTDDDSFKRLRPRMTDKQKKVLDEWEYMFFHWKG